MSTVGQLYEPNYEFQPLPEGLDSSTAVLKHLFGHDSFRPGQEEVIESVLRGKDTIALLPTGGGKTVIYSVAVVVLSGITFVIQPLKSLMEEQVNTLRKKNIVAFFINTYLSEEQIRSVTNSLMDKSLKYAVVFTSPEKINRQIMGNLLAKLSEQQRIGFIAVDEAHCIDVWGGSFREDYSKLKFLKKFKTPVLALSGSATERTVKVIQENLDLSEPLIQRTTFQRDNLTINVIKKSDKPTQQIVKLIKDKYPDKCGIVYCSRTETTKDIAYTLKTKGISSTYVHGKMSDFERRRNECFWKSGKALVICATKSFGMGIDKPDVRFVLHFDITESLEDYLQQIGHAGRDCQPAECTQLFSFKDRYFHLNNLCDVKTEKEKSYKTDNLHSVTQFCIQDVIA